MIQKCMPMANEHEPNGQMSMRPSEHEPNGHAVESIDPRGL